MPASPLRLPIYVTFSLALSGISFVAVAAYPDQPDFEDYRRLGNVVEKYSRNRENNTYGVTLKLRENSIRTLADGRVHSQGRLRGYGRFVIIDHGQGWHSLYSHLSRVEAQQGKEVRRGTIIGTARGKRLFLVVSYRGNPINPSEVMSVRKYSEELNTAAHN